MVGLAVVAGAVVGLAVVAGAVVAAGVVVGLAVVAGAVVAVSLHVHTCSHALFTTQCPVTKDCVHTISYDGLFQQTS